MNEALRMQLNKEGSAVRCTMVSPYYIDTGMFEGVRTRFSFLLPILKQEAVARRILTAVRRNAVAFAPPFGRVDGNYTIKSGPAAASLFCAHVYKGVLAHPESGG